MIIVSAGIIVNQQGAAYSSETISDLDEFNKMNDVSREAQVQQGSINPQSGEASSDAETETYRGAYGIVTNIWGVLRGVYGSEGIIQNAGKRWGIPDYVLNGLVTMFSIAIALGIVAIVFRTGKEQV